MYVYPDGTVTGSVDVAELDKIQAAQKGVSKARLASLGPVETAAQLSELLKSGGGDSKPEQPKATKAKATRSKAAKASPRRFTTDSKTAADTAEAMSRVDLPDVLAKATTTNKENS